VNGSIGSPRAPRPHDVFADDQEHQELGRGDTEWGTVGWDGDATRADVCSLGDGSDGPKGRTLVNVTLFKGRDLDKRPEKGKAQGRRIRAQISGRLWGVPKPGTQVIVTFPGGDQETPGNAVITDWVDTSPTAQFKADRWVLDAGDDVDLVIKARTVLLMDHSGDAPGSFGAWFCVGPNAGGAVGIYANDGKGAGIQVSGGVFAAMGTDGANPPAGKSMLQLGPSDATLTYAGGGYLTITAAKLDAFHQSQANVIAATVGLGTAPAIPCLHSLYPGPGIPSTCVLVT
jgi:hypothetical protein